MGILFWTVAASVALCIEMLTGTLYLLVLCLASAAAAVAAHYEASTATQVGVFGAICALGFVGLQLRRRALKDFNAQSPHSDAGALVQVLADTGEGRFRVRYRGTEWDAELAEGQARDTQAQVLRISHLKGNTLICVVD